MSARSGWARWIAASSWSKNFVGPPTGDSGKQFRPGTIPEGYVTDTLVSLVDIYPTLAALTGAVVPVGLDGRDLSEWFAGRPLHEREFVCAEGDFKRAWCRTTRWKLYNTGELYDLKRDPQETRPRRGHWRMRRELRAALDGLGED